jgi:hypothetical protein
MARSVGGKERAKAFLSTQRVGDPDGVDVFYDLFR